MSRAGLTGRRLAVGAAVVAAFSLVLSPVALLSGLPGACLLVLGVRAGKRTSVSLGAGLLVVGAFTAIAVDARPVVVLLSVAAAVVAWDAGTNAIELAAHLGAGAETGRAETVHAAASSLVLAAGTGLAVTGYRLASGGEPALALTALLFGAVVLAALLRA